MSFITVPGRDIIVVDEATMSQDISYDYKIHLIRLKFKEPNLEKMRWVTNTFKKTNRYVVDSQNVRFYNQYLKNTNLKYYIINTINNWYGLISFFKRNNKVLLDITSLSEFEKQFVLNVALDDILTNTEVIIIDKKDYNIMIDTFNQWRGDIIINNPKYPI